MLTSGAAIRVERHESAGELVRLYTPTGEIELPASAVASFEPMTERPAAAALPAAAAMIPSQTAASAPERVADRHPKAMLDEAADRYGLPAALLHSVARVESAYRVDALSQKGAIGVMQLMPATAAELGADPHDPEQNVDAGARHLRDLLLQNGGSAHRALAAYNAGQKAVERYGGIPPYRETTLYVEKVLRNYLRAAPRPAVQ